MAEGPHSYFANGYGAARLNCSGELAGGCSGNNDVLHEGSLVGQMAKRQVWAKGLDGDGGLNLCCLGS